MQLLTTVRAILPALLVFSWGWTSTSHAEQRALHWSGKKQVWDRKIEVVTLSGAATLVQPGEVLSADEMRIDLRRRVVEARGNCLFITRDLVMQGQFMQFNLDTRNGYLDQGRISTEGFTMSGSRISRLGVGRFQAFDAEYTTCKDCPQSWSFTGEKVDMTFGGYAHLWGVRGKVGDVPVTWLPYLVFPLKTQRQSGLLMPRFGLSGADGFVFVQPFFWAINRSADLTLGIGSYSLRGFRAEMETRYRISDDSDAQASVFIQRDRTYFPVIRNFAAGTQQEASQEPLRWAFLLDQRHQLNRQWSQKLVVREVRDTDYPSQIGDIPGRLDSMLGSSLAFTRSTPQSSFILSGHRFRNRLGEDPLSFDRSVVQPLPSLLLTSNERPLIYGFNGGLSFGLVNFTRGTGSFDPDILGNDPSPILSGGEARPGIDPLRQATRLTLVPRIYSTTELIDGVSLVPSAEYRSSYYAFPEDSGVSALTRGYLLTQLDATAQWERRFGDRFKHFIRPRLRYSLIPAVHESADHPFVQQIEYAQNRGFSGYNFDNIDIIPRDTGRSYNNYFLPLGNALTVEVSSQLLGRRGRSGAFSRLVEFSAGQTVNFREYRLPETERQPFSRFSSALQMEFDGLSSSINYFY